MFEKCPVCSGGVVTTSDQYESVNRTWYEEQGYQRDDYDLQSHCSEGCFSFVRYSSRNDLRVGREYIQWQSRYRDYSRSGEPRWLPGKPTPQEQIDAAVEKLRQGRDSLPDLQKEFLKAIKKDPYDAVSRAAYADWLEEQGRDDEAQHQRQWTPERQVAEGWLRDFAEKNGVPYHDILQAGHDWIDREDWYTQMGRESLRDELHASVQEFWQNWKLVTGVDVPDDTAMPFSCSC